MTVAWLAVAMAALCWPLDPVASRVRALGAGQRLAAAVGRVGPDRVARRSATGATASRLGGVAARALSNVVVCRFVAIGAGVLASACALPFGALTVLSIGLTATVATGVGVALVRNHLQRRRHVHGEVALSQALAVVAAELEAGVSPAVALSAAGPLGVTIGAALAAADGSPASVPDGPDALLRVVTAWQVSNSAGVPLVDVLGRVRADLAMSAAVRREVSVTVAGPRSSAVLLALLPVLGIGLGTAMSADPAGILLTTSAGRLLLCGGVLLDALGLFWTDVLIGRAQR